MQVEVQRTGGVAGRTVRWSLDLATLDADQRAEVQDLLGQAPGWAGSAAPDRFSYRVVTLGEPGAGSEAEEPAAGLDVRFAEPLPEPARRLLDVVRAATG